MFSIFYRFAKYGIRAKTRKLAVLRMKYKSKSGIIVVSVPTVFTRSNGTTESSMEPRLEFDIKLRLLPHDDSLILKVQGDALAEVW